MRRVKRPLAQVCIYILIRHALEEHVRSKAGHTADAHAALHGVKAGGKGSHRAAKRLLADVIHLLRSEGLPFTTAQSSSSRHMLAYDQVIGLEYAVLSTEQRTHIHIELQPKQKDKHAQQIGGKEASQLQGADVSAQ